MKTHSLFAIAMAAMLFASCGGNGTIKPVTTKVNGPLGNYFEVVDRDYKVKDGNINVEYKRIAEGGPKEASWTSEPTFTIELLDKDGDLISSSKTNVVWTEESLETVFALNVGESATIPFSFDDTQKAVQLKALSTWDEDAEKPVEEKEEDYAWLSERLLEEEDLEDLDASELEILRNAIYARHGWIFKRDDLREFFSQFSWYEPTTRDVTLSSIESKNVSLIKQYEAIASSSSASSRSGFNNWDELLDQYERYANDYISYLKKAANGDMDAISESVRLIEEIEELSDELDDAKGDMTTSQANRLIKINTKLANAAADMY